MHHHRGGRHGALSVFRRSARVAITIPDTEPVQLTAGESWAWNRALGDYRASDGWTLKYSLRGAKDLDITADAAGDEYQVRVPAATTAPVTAGTYRLVGFVEKDADRFVVCDKTVAVLANPLTAVNAKSHTERTLEIIEAAIEGTLTDAEASWTIGGKSVTKYSPKELFALRNQYLEQLRQEQSSWGAFRSMAVRFGPPA